MEEKREEKTQGKRKYVCLGEGMSICDGGTRDCKGCINVYVHYEADHDNAAHALSLHNYHRKETEGALYQQCVLLRSCQRE